MRNDLLVMNSSDMTPDFKMLSLSLCKTYHILSCLIIPHQQLDYFSFALIRSINIKFSYNYGNDLSCLKNLSNTRINDCTFDSFMKGL